MINVTKQRGAFIMDKAVHDFVGNSLIHWQPMLRAGVMCSVFRVPWWQFLRLYFGLAGGVGVVDSAPTNSCCSNQAGINIMDTATAFAAFVVKKGRSLPRESSADGTSTPSQCCWCGLACCHLHQWQGPDISQSQQKRMIFWNPR